MKVECIKKTTDLNKIQRAIDCIRMSHKGQYPSYIIMSYETKAEIINEHSETTIIRELLNDWKGQDRLFNIPIAYYEGLKFGEVDIV